MCLLLKKKKREKIKNNLLEYIRNTYVPVEPHSPKKDTSSDVRYSIRDSEETRYSDRDTSNTRYSDRNNFEVRYSLSIPEEILLKDHYNENIISRALGQRNGNTDATKLSGLLLNSTAQSFVECMLIYLRRKGFRDSDLYKAAQIDRRLYSKMISDYQHKPSKDTAVAICFALKLTIAEANDLINRAGYSLSHSTKRDIIIEYFFKERVYDVTEINMVLFELGEKPLGR